MLELLLEINIPVRMMAVQQSKYQTTANLTVYKKVTNARGANGKAGTKHVEMSDKFRVYSLVSHSEKIILN